MIQTSSSIKILRPDQGESLWAMGEKLTFKLGPADTGGAFGFSEIVAQPGGGPPPHIHRREDEMFYVLDGEFDFPLGNRTFTRSTGFAACLPKDLQHTYNNVGKRPGRLLGAVFPCGFEAFIREWSHPVKDSSETPPVPTQQDINKLVAAAPKYGIELCADAKSAPDLTTPPADPAYWVLGQLVTIKLASKETRGNFSVAEVSSFPGDGVPSHLHLTMDELLYVLEGVFEFTFDARIEQVSAGTLVFVPRGTLHGFRNVNDRTSRLFDLHSPGGFEAFFQEAGIPATDPNSPPPGEPPDLDRLLALFRKHGMELRLP